MVILFSKTAVWRLLTIHFTNGTKAQDGGEGGGFIPQLLANSRNPLAKLCAPHYVFFIPISEPIKPKEVTICCAGLGRSVVSDSLPPHGLWPTRLLHPWYSPGKNTGMDCHSLLLGIFLTQRLNPVLLHGRKILYSLSHQERPFSLDKSRESTHFSSLIPSPQCQFPNLSEHCVLVPYTGAWTLTIMSQHCSRGWVWENMGRKAWLKFKTLIKELLALVLSYSPSLPRKITFRKSTKIKTKIYNIAF